MTSRAQRNVREFHRKHGEPNPDQPTPLTKEQILMRARLIYEEVTEMVAAADEGDFEGFCDGLADLDYVVQGTAVAAGVCLQSLHEEVHASNMTKDHDPEARKIRKGPNFRPPDIARAVRGPQED